MIGDRQWCFRSGFTLLAVVIAVAAGTLIGLFAVTYVTTPALIDIGVVGIAAGVFVTSATRSVLSVEPVERATLCTAASGLTLVRGGLVAGLALFVLAPYPSGAAAWVPAVVFGGAALLDAADGRLARLTDTDGQLGARLDASADAFTVLVGSVVVVSAGLGPLAFLVVGGAHYVFVGGLRLRQRRNRPVRQLQPSQRRRLVGVFLMAVLFLALSPVLEPPWSVWLTAVAIVPTVASFGWDWLAATGRVGSHASVGGELSSVETTND